ncbi:Protein kinase domain-containing protein [Forsythia ovata]|uniref:non-specific serine/threonine protein kinase n=1 Tax=Forsythia ovata TaxID=205694 RepID=A0ABD1PVX9_9LAMI
MDLCLSQLFGTIPPQEAPIINRDILSTNILLDSQYKACISDFGTSKFLKCDSLDVSALAGMYGYVAPELAYAIKVSEKCGAYSFGVLALEVIKGKHPGEYIQICNNTITWKFTVERFVGYSHNVSQSRRR